MTVVSDAIAADLLTLTRVVDVPAEPLGWGTDLSCVRDCTRYFDEVDPFSPVGIAEAAIRRLTCPRDGLPDDPDYGIYLPGYVNRGITQQQLRDMDGQITNELRKDDRVENADVSCVYIYATNVLTVAVVITPADSDLVAFRFTMAVSDSAVLLETIN